MGEDRTERDLASIGALADPVRRRLYLFVVRAAREVGRDEAARATGVSRSLAAFHLDRLVDEDLLQAGYRRLSGRSGPGAGRPAKVYRPGRPIEVAVPERDYALAGTMLIEGIRGLDGPDGPSEERVREEGRARGRAARGSIEGRKSQRVLLDAARRALEEMGFRPSRGDDGSLRLLNCPFDALATRYPDTMCRLNRSFVEGVLEGIGASRLSAVPEPRDDGCCVSIRANASAAPPRPSR